MNHNHEIILKDPGVVAEKSKEYLEQKLIEANCPPFPWQGIKNSFVEKVRQIIK